VVQRFDATFASMAGPQKPPRHPLRARIRVSRPADNPAAARKPGTSATVVLLAANDHLATNDHVPTNQGRRTSQLP
jgi:hypothetical protein